MRKTIQFLFCLAILVAAERASAATLSISPATANVAENQTINVDIVLDTTGQSADGVDIFSLNYNPNLLQVVDANTSTSGVQITPGTLMPVTIVNNVNATTGKIQFSQTPSGGGSYTGSGVLASITFRAIGGGTTNLYFDYTAGSTSDTNVAGGGTDRLTSVSAGTVVSQGPAPTNPPPPPMPTPVFPPVPTPGPTPDKYPSGIIFKYSNSPTVYVKEGASARPITDWTVYLNNVPPTRHIVTIPSTVTFPQAPVLGLRSGTLIRASNNPTVYLMVGTSKRPFSSESEFLNNSYRFDQVYTINDPTLVNSITTTTAEFQRPIGTLFKYANNSTVYFLNSARTKRPFTTWAMYTLWVDNPRNVITVPSSETYPDGAIIKLPNGVLVKGTTGSTVYITDQDMLRPFSNQTLFTSMGFNFSQVVTIPDADIALHQVGSAME